MVIKSCLQKSLLALILLTLLTLPGPALANAAHPAKSDSALSSPTPRDWTINGPVGGTVTVFAAESAQGNVIYAGGPGGIWKSTNSGNTWQSLPGSPAPVTIMMVDPVHTANLYAGNDGWIYKSADGGKSWNAIYQAPLVPIPNNPGNHARFISLAIDPHNPNNLFIGGDHNPNGTLYRSTDGGKNWTITLPAVIGDVTKHPFDITQLVVDPFIPSTVYVVDALLDLCRSYDSGSTFNCVQDGTTFIISQVYAVPDQQNVLFAAPRGWMPVIIGNLCMKKLADFYRSNNGGYGWFNMGPNFDTCNSIWPSPNVSSYGYQQSIVASGCIGGFVLVSAGHTPNTISGNAGVYRGSYTTTGGPVWTKVNTNLGNGLNGLQGGPLALSCATGGVFVGMPNGIYRTDSAGQIPLTWQEKNQGLTNAVVTSLAVSTDASHFVYAGTVGNGIFKSFDHGATWVSSSRGIAAQNTQPVVGSLVHQVYSLAADNAGHVYAATNNGLYRSFDFGYTWNLTTIPAATSVAIDPQHPGTAYAYGLSCTGYVPDWTCSGQMYASPDFGQTWTGIVSPQTASPLNLVVIGPANSPMYALGSKDGLYSLTGSGGWTHLAGVDFCTSSNPCQALAINPALPSWIFIGAQDGLYRSTNSGSTWTKIAFTGYSVTSIVVNPTNSYLYVGAKDRADYLSGDGGKTWARPSGGAWQSSDGGLTWANLDLPLNRSVDAVAYDPDTSLIYAGMEGLGVAAGVALPRTTYMPFILN